MLGFNPLSAGAKSPAFAPWRSSRCLMWYDAALPLTYGAALAAAGTTPAAATLSGSQTIFAPVDLAIKCTTSGITGFAATALGSVYTDGGTTPIATGVTLGQNVPLTGSLSGLSVTFANGNAVSTSTQNVWRGYVGSQNSAKGTGVLVPINSSKPRVISPAAGICGGPAFFGDGASNALHENTTALGNPAGGLFFWGVMQVTNGSPPTSSQQCMVSGGNTITPLVLCDNPATFGIHYNFGSQRELTPGVTLGTPKRMLFNVTPGTQFLQWGSALHTEESGSNTTSTGITILARQDLAGVTFLNGMWACGGWFSGTPTGGGLASLLDAWSQNSGGRFPTSPSGLLT